MSHTLTIHKSDKYSSRLLTNTVRSTKSRATCSCGWSSGWKSTEHLARNEFDNHLYNYSIYK